MVFQHPAVVVDVGMLEIQLATGTATDKWHRELAGLIEGLYHEGFTAGESIHVNHGKGMVGTEAERCLMLVNLPLDGGYTLVYGHGNIAAAYILIWQGNGHNVGILDHAVGIGLQQHHAAVFPSIAIEGVAAGRAAQLSGGGQENQLGICRNQALDGTGHIGYGKVRGHEAIDHGTALGNIQKLLEMSLVQLRAVEIGNLDVLLGQGRGGSLGGQRLCCWRSCLCPLALEEIKHNMHLAKIYL